MISETYNTDCLEAMRGMADNQFALAIVDPPYGINASHMGSRFSRYSTPEQRWDKDVPTDEYFQQLFRVSVNQIIWGGNYFSLGYTRGFVIWDKQQPEGVSFASCEFAWSSFERSAGTFYRRPQGEVRIHPTQKPIELYAWLLKNYAKQGDTILDTHLGSGSSRIAAYDLGFDFTGYELDKDYFEAQEKRFANHIAQPKLFEAPAPVQQTFEMAA